METLDTSADVPGDRAKSAKPLTVRLQVTSAAREKLGAALASPDARDKWLRIFPQGIS